MSTTQLASMQAIPTGKALGVEIVGVDVSRGLSDEEFGFIKRAWLDHLVLLMPLEHSEQLLDRLWAHATQDKYVWRHRWQPGDLLVGDNRCTMHRRDSFDDGHRRVMHRAQVRGTIPSAP